MNRTSWVFVGITILICAAIGFLYIRPVATSSLKIYQEEYQAKKDLQDVSKRKEVLTNLAKNNQLNDLYDVASKYIPDEANSGALVIELTAIAEKTNLKVEQISLDSDEESSKESNNEESTKKEGGSTEQTTQNTGVQELPFSMKLSGTFIDFLSFLQNLEKSSRLMTISAMTLTQEQDKFTAEIEGKTYWKKGTDLEKTLANVEISKATIEKFQSLTTFGTPINLPSESGFGRENPFENL